MCRVGEPCRSKRVQHLTRRRQIRHALGQVSIRSGVGKPPSDARNDATEVKAVSEANERIARNADVEKCDAAARSNDSREFLEECRQVDEISQREATRCTIDTRRCNRKIQDVGLTTGGT
jgi:hypothetical protein